MNHVANNLAGNLAGNFVSVAQKNAILASGGCTTGLPNLAYTSDEFFQWEKENLFVNTWTCVGSVCDVPEAGCLKPVDFLGAPLVMVRDANHDHGQAVKVFHNVCSHRGNQLVWSECKVNKLISCPYHSWTYDLAGNLQATPHVGGTGKHDIEGLDKSAHGLRQARCAVWMGLVFVNLSETAPEFSDFIAPLQKRVEGLLAPGEFTSGELTPSEFATRQFDALRPASSHDKLTIEFNGNWKLCLENNLESYHLPWVHPGLNAVSKLEDHYHFYGDEYAGQGSVKYDYSKIQKKVFPLIAGWREQIAEYPTLYPNVFLGLHCDHFWTRIIEPIAPNVTRDHLQLYYLGDAAADEEYAEARKRRMQAWAEVFYEDVGVVEGMQRGRQSPAFTGGVFTPLMDEPSHHFAKWVAGQL